MDGFRLLCNNSKVRNFMDKNFVGAPKTMKSIVFKIFRLYVHIGVIFTTSMNYAYVLRSLCYSYKLVMHGQY